MLVGFDTRGQSEYYVEPTKETVIEVPEAEKPKKFDKNDPSTYKYSSLYKKWQFDSDFYNKPPSPKKKGLFDFSSSEPEPKIVYWGMMYQPNDSPALKELKLKE